MWQARMLEIPSFDRQKTLELFLYSYPTKSLDFIILSCSCGKTAKRTAADAYCKYRSKIFFCKSCAASNRSSNIDWKTRCDSVRGYLPQHTLSQFGYEYPTKSNSKVCVECCSCSYVSSQEVSEFLNRDYQCKTCVAKSSFESRKKQMFENRDIFWSKEENRLKASETAKNQPERSKRLRALNKDPFWTAKRLNGFTKESRERQRQATSADWVNSRSKRLAALKKANKVSTEEDLLAYLMDYFQIKYERQYILGPYIFDFYIPEKNILIEFDGHRFHHPDFVLRQRKDQLRVDKSKTGYVRNQHPDLKLFRFTEADLYVKGFHESLNWLDQSPTFFNLDDVSVGEVDTSEAVKFLTLFHYKENQRQALGRGVGAFHAGKLIAVASFTGVLRREIATSLGLDPKEMLELSRFCIHPKYHGNNFASWFLSKSLKVIKEAYPHLLGVATFADTTMGHQGTIYKATNFSFIHEVPEDYHYKHKLTGKFMHKRTLWGIAKKLQVTETVYSSTMGYEKVYGAKKLKFVFWYQ